jgi:hypothetical protein
VERVIVIVKLTLDHTNTKRPSHSQGIHDNKANSKRLREIGGIVERTDGKLEQN